jgi:hypothetical protein
MPRKSPKEMYERIQPYVEQYARQYYGGALEHGFRHWAFQERFLEHHLSDTDIVDKTEIDGSDDFEIDGYFIEETEEEKAVHLFQCKYRNPGTALGSKELSAFLDSPTKLLDPRMVASCHNAETKNLHDQLIKLIPQGCFIDLTWATNGRLSQQARLYAQSNALRSMTFQIGGTSYDCTVSLEALDIGDLDALFQSRN